MKTTHAGLGITNSDWDVMVKHLNATFDKFSVPAKERDEVLGALGPLKKDIVEKP
jgi:hemoglobin